jgi:uncharacterized protein with beta-barrel porin domain
MAVSPTASDQINVIGPDGIITLGVHKLQLDFEPGLYAPRTYTLLSASQEIRGQIDTATAITPPANFTGRAFTTSKEVLLTLTADLGRDLTLSDNQSAVSNSLDSVYNASGVIAAGPAGLYGLTGPALGNALTATTGEVATGFHVATVRMNNRLLSMLLDPFIDGRTDFSAAGQPDSTEDRGWSGWAGAYAGFDNVNGNAVVGSQNLSDNTQGFVMGLDYRVSGSTVVGVAVGVGGTQWSLDGSFGTGSSLAIQAGAYASTTLGPVYLSGAFSFIQQWGSTDRNVLGERLTADPDAQSFGGRIEAGYRLETGFGAFTPYAAGQSQWFNSGDYGELSIAGNGFALDYAGQSTSDQRTELGFRFETRPKSSDARQLMFQARAAWAHDWPGERSMEAAFRSVPGSDFVVEGAQLSTNLALLSAGAQLNISKAVALQALFNAELGDNSTTLGGSLALSFAF